MDLISLYDSGVHYIIARLQYNNVCIILGDLQEDWQPLVGALLPGDG